MRPRYVVAASAMLLGGAFIVLTGAIPIDASSGHWRMTAWMLDFIKRRSIAAYSRQVTPPAHEWRSWVTRGAAHYETGCRPCHGSPLSPRPPLVMRMTPHPPELPPRINRWDPRELFQIVRHGIKFTAMPAWMAPQRPDEVWAMVAFLRALPAMPAHEYRERAFGATTTADGVAAVERCTRCHGVDGMGRGGMFPVLAGQRPEYLHRALVSYREGRRHSGFMRVEAAELDDSTRDTVVRYFARLPRTGWARKTDPAGGSLVTSGDPPRQIPACSQCHGPSPIEHNPAYPTLAGQDADYLFEQLVLFSENRRGGSAFAPIMQAIALRLTRDQMRQAADEYSGLP